MKPTLERIDKAFTLIELLVVVLTIALMFLLAVPIWWPGPGPKPARVLCMNNLKQVGVGFMLYSLDNSNRLPWQASAPTANAAEIYLKLTPYLKQPKAFICPADKTRQPAQANYSPFGNSNLSYFASLDALFDSTPRQVRMVLAGDRHLALAQQPVSPGRLSITNAAAMSWTKELHGGEDNAETLGVLLFADGHVEAVKSQKLPLRLQNQDLVTNQLVIP